MVEKRGLGRGLSALLEEASEAPEDGGIAPERDMPIELIRRNPDQPRKHFDEDEINELAASIRRRGILQPILVRPGVADGDTRSSPASGAGGRRKRRACAKFRSSYGLWTSLKSLRSAFWKTSSAQT